MPINIETRETGDFQQVVILSKQNIDEDGKTWEIILIQIFFLLNRHGGSSKWHVYRNR